MSKPREPKMSRASPQVNLLFPDIRERLESRKYLNNVYWEQDIARLLKAVDLAETKLHEIMVFGTGSQGNSLEATIAYETLAQLAKLSEPSNGEET